MPPRRCRCIGSGWSSAVLLGVVGAVWIGQGMGFLPGSCHERRPVLGGRRDRRVGAGVVPRLGHAPPALTPARRTRVAGAAAADSPPRLTLRSPARRQPRLPGRLGRAGADVVPATDQRQAEQTLVGQQPLDESRGRPSAGRPSPASRIGPALACRATLAAPSRSANRRSSPAAIGLRRRSTKWIAIRRSLKNRWAARVARSSARPKIWTVGGLIGRDRVMSASVLQGGGSPAGGERSSRGRGHRPSRRATGYHPRSGGDGVTVWFTVRLEDRPGSLARVAPRSATAASTSPGSSASPRTPTAR